MKELHSEKWEREGNDAWLIDTIRIVIEDDELCLYHKVNHKGWGGPIKETHTIDLEEYGDVDSQQNKIREYMDFEGLLPEMQVPNLRDLLDLPQLEKRYIICSAVKYKDHIIHGRRHGDAYQTLEKLLSKEEYDKITRDNTIAGFVDQYGDFYDRKEAYVIADDADQIKYGKGTQEAEDKIVLNVDGEEWQYKGDPLLISEHLFPDKDD